MSWTPYTKWIDKLKKYKAENQYYNQANQQQKKLAQSWNELSQNLQLKSQSGDLTDSALADMLMKSQNSFANVQRDIFNQADDRINQRNEMIDSKIDDAELKNDFYIQQQKEIDEQKRKQKKEDKKSWLATGLQGAGALIGAGLGSVIPGAGTVAGASIGAGLGSLAGAAVTKKTQYITQGIQDTLSGFNSMAVLQDEKNFYDTLSQLDYNALDTKELPLLIGILQSGDDKLLIDFINKKKKPLPVIEEQTYTPGYTYKHRTW
ncbi:MAG TPA: hypothetical protein PK816_10905 [Candidatus Cloacimonadota bacterium]|nr:hypothetical protein [Candidatus Cloacimonadota bacterium]